MDSLKFPAQAPSTALTIGAGVARGLQNATQSYIRGRQQQQQMQIQMQRNQMMAQIQQQRNEIMRQSKAGGSLADLQLMQAMAKGGHVDPATLRPLIKDRVQTLLDNANPAEKQSLASSIERQTQAGQIPGEISNSMQLSPSMVGFAKSAVNTEGQVEKTQAVQNSLAERSQAIAGARPTADQKASQTAMENYTSQMKGVHQNMMALDKPPALGQAPMSDDVKANLRNSYTQDLTDLQEKYNQAYSRASGVPRSDSSPSNQADQSRGSQGAFYPTPSGAPPPQILTPDKWQQAQPGNIVTTPDGRGYVTRLPGNHPDGTANFSQTFPTVQAAQSYAQQTAGGLSPQTQAAPTSPLAPIANTPAAAAIAPTGGAPAAPGGQ